MVLQLPVLIDVVKEHFVPSYSSNTSTHTCLMLLCAHIPSTFIVNLTALLVIHLTCPVARGMTIYLNMLIM